MSSRRSQPIRSRPKPCNQAIVRLPAQWAALVASSHSRQLATTVSTCLDQPAGDTRHVRGKLVLTVV
ncbi:hypothetical protein [Streptomyces hokutonensis]|uniref:hypothetical protein n=1 Tax=Streptomyces hokutonensis TaxID=1306990 RepID=UPI0036901B6B